MKCANCESPAVGDLGLCAAHDQEFRQSAAEAAAALERDEPGSEFKARKLQGQHARLVFRAMVEPLVPSIRALAAKPQPQPKPAALPVLGGLTKGE